MIRLIQRRLIIPRGDTGTFSIPMLPGKNAGDVSIFTVFDPLVHRKVFEKPMTIVDDVLNIEFTHNDTVNLPVGSYVWDIKFYSDPQFIDNKLVNGTEIDSYYAAFALPPCEIRETGDNLLMDDNAPQGTLSPDSLNFITAAIAEITAIKNDIIANAPTVTNLAAVATSGSYNDLEDKPTIPDIQIEGTSIIENGIANIPIASSGVPGVVGIDSLGGITVGFNNNLEIHPASNADIKSGNQYLKPIVPSRQDRAVFYGLATAAGADESASQEAFGTYREPAKAAIRNMIGAAAVSDIPDISGKANTTDLASVATSGSYNDLFNKPFIPSAISDLTDDSGHYTKPAGGIPASDLANGVLDVWSGLTYHTSTMSTDSDSFVLGGATDAPTEINKCLVTSTPDANVIPKFDYQGRLHSVTPEDEWDGSNTVATTEYVDNMISDNMPEIPANVSELNNDAGYLTSYTETDPTVPSWAKAAQKPNYTAAEVGAPTVQEMNSAISSAIGNINSFDMAVAQELPTQDISTHTIYLVPKTGETNDVYDEYVYINNAWEMIGNTQIDLSNYVQKTDYATDTEAGIVKVFSGYGLDIIEGGYITFNPAPTSLIKSGQSQKRIIAPFNQHESTFYGLAKAAGADMSSSGNPVGQYTNDARRAIRDMIGANEWVQVVDNTTVGAAITFNYTFDHAFRELFAYIVIQGTTSATDLSISGSNEDNAIIFTQSFANQIDTTQKTTLVSITSMPGLAVCKYNTDNDNSQIRRSVIPNSVTDNKIKKITIGNYSSVSIPAGSVIKIYAR